MNQDATGEAEAEGFALWALADGLGGHARGEVAARLAVDRCLAHFRADPSLEPGALEERVLAAHQALRAVAQSRRAEDDVRSTLVLLALDGSSARWAHVGDSRLYHFRGGRVRSRTWDHSVPELLHRAGEIGEAEIRGHPDRNRLLRVLGQEPALRVSVSDLLALRSGDAFLLCSDGWWEQVPEETMEAALARARDPTAWLARMEEGMRAPDGSARDNYTAVAVTVG